MSDLTDADKQRLFDIIQCPPADTRRLAHLIFDYYRDADRANRTSREQMYLHLGMMAGALSRTSRDEATVVQRSGRRNDGPRE